MADSSAQKMWLGRGFYLLLCFVLIFLQLLPLETLPPSWGDPGLVPLDPLADIDGVLQEPASPGARLWGGPDLLLLVTLAWSARRPDYLPAVLVAAVFLLADALFHRPPGLWAALVLILSEILRSRAHGLRVLPFPLEWLGVAAGITAITLMNRFTLALVLVPQASLGLTLVNMMTTILVYPVVVFVSYLIFGVSRPAQGEVDSLGHRL